ncbi:MAG: zinc ribbon domain-containing protein [Promethearchaeota archaeon]
MRFFPSSKLRANCLYYHTGLKLQDRIYVCPLCGLRIDRDLNAARNLVNYYHFYGPLIQTLFNPFDNLVTVSSSDTLNACGESVRPSTSGPNFMNQE